MRDRLRAGWVAALLLATVAAACAAPDLTPPPAFSAADRRVIGRNEALSRALGRDPWLVRRLLDDIARQNGTALAPPDGLDPVKNPDLRTSPEATYDLFQLLKRAAADKQKGTGR